MLSENEKNTLGWIGIVVGSVSLVLALVHFYAGPFSPQPTLEQAVAQKAVSIRKATVAMLKGEEVEQPATRAKFDADRVTHLVVAVLGALAVILSAIGFAKKESKRVVVSALGLGVAGIAFQLLTIALGAIILAILIAAVLGSLGIS